MPTGDERRWWPIETRLSPTSMMYPSTGVIYDANYVYRSYGISFAVTQTSVRDNADNARLAWLENAQRQADAALANYAFTRTEAPDFYDFTLTRPRAQIFHDIEPEDL